MSHSLKCHNYIKPIFIMCIYLNSYTICAVPLHVLNYPLNKSHLIESLFASIVTGIRCCHNGRRRMALWENVLIVEWASVLPLTMAFAIGPVKAGHFSITETMAVRLWHFALASLTYRECSENKFVTLCTFYPTHKDFKRDIVKAN